MHSPKLTPRDAAQRLQRFFETLTPESLAQLPALYAPDAQFKDPFNEVQGVPAIVAVFEHMYASLEAPRFVVRQCLVDGDQAFMSWDFVFRFRRFDTQTEQTVRGATHLAFDEQGRVRLHRDYWDAAEELYAKLPVLGGFMRWLQRRARQ